MGGHLPVNVRVDDHVIIESVDAVIEYSSMCPYVDAVYIFKRAEVRESVVNFCRDGTRADSLVFASLDNTSRDHLVYHGYGKTS